jgi:hypothetical protein
VLPAHRLTLDEIDVRGAANSGIRAGSGCRDDDDELVRLAPLGNRVVSLAVQGNLRDLSVLSSFPNLEALSLHNHTRFAHSAHKIRKTAAPGTEARFWNERAACRRVWKLSARRQAVLRELCFREKLKMPT